MEGRMGRSAERRVQGSLPTFLSTLMSLVRRPGNETGTVFKLQDVACCFCPSKRKVVNYGDKLVSGTLLNDP